MTIITNPYQRGTILRFTECELRVRPLFRGTELRCEQDYGDLLSDYLGPVLYCSVLRVADAFRSINTAYVGRFVSIYLSRLEPMPEVAVTQSRRLTVIGKDSDEC